MARSINKVILIGNLGGKPEVRRTQNNTKIVSFSVATSERWKDKQTGEPREKTEWHRVVLFNEGLANVAEKYLEKGSRVYIEGALQTRKWTGDDGHERQTTEVVLQGYRCELTMLDSRGSAGAGDNAATSEPTEWDNVDASGPSGNNGGGSGGKAPGTELDDEIPF